MPRRRRMDPIFLIERVHPGYACQQKWYQRNVISPRYGGIDVVKRFGVLGAEIWKRFHAKQDDTGIGSLLVDPFDDRLNIGFQRLEVLTPQPIVRAGLDQQDGRLFPHDPIDPLQRPRRAFSTDPGIDYAIVQAQGIDFLLNHGGIGLIQLHAESGGQAGAKEENDGQVGRGGRRIVCGALGARGTIRATTTS